MDRGGQPVAQAALLKVLKRTLRSQVSCQIDLHGVNRTILGYYAAGVHARESVSEEPQSKTK